MQLIYITCFAWSISKDDGHDVDNGTNLKYTIPYYISMRQLQNTCIIRTGDCGILQQVKHKGGSRPPVRTLGMGDVTGDCKINLL